MFLLVFFFKQKTAYEMRISDWSSDVCSSDLLCRLPSGDIARGARGADATAGRRIDGARDRPRLPVERGGDRGAHHAREASDRQGRSGVRGAPRTGAGAPARLRARGNLSDLQWRLWGDRGAGEWENGREGKRVGIG